MRPNPSLTLLAGIALAGCGHLAPWSESPLDHVEIYSGVDHPYQLRVLAQVQVYDLIPRRYVAWEWIPLDGAGNSFAVDAHAIRCHEGSEEHYVGHRLRGKVTLDANDVHLHLEEFTTNEGGVMAWQTYRFNGQYRVQRVEEPAIRIASLGICSLHTKGKH